MTEKVILLDYLRQKTNDAELFRKLLYRSLGFKPKRAGETLSENPNPQLNNLNTILQAMGYRHHGTKAAICNSLIVLIIS